jgi:hypothetical protein
MNGLAFRTLVFSVFYTYALLFWSNSKSSQYTGLGYFESNFYRFLNTSISLVSSVKCVDRIFIASRSRALD